MEQCVHCGMKDIVSFFFLLLYLKHALEYQFYFYDSIVLLSDTVITGMLIQEGLNFIHTLARTRVRTHARTRAHTHTHTYITISW